MKLLDLDQGSLSWLQWRRSVITATDASVIMEVNPYCNITELRLRKLGLIPEIATNFVMQRGKDLEEPARLKFNFENDLNLSPAVVECSKHPFLGASLDGISKDGRYILEIKCPGKKGMQIAKNGEILPYYLTQMLHQLLVTGAEMCYYYCYDGQDGHTIEVYPDKKWEEEYLPKAEEFWMSLIFPDKTTTKYFMQEMTQDEFTKMEKKSNISNFKLNLIKRE